MATSKESVSAVPHECCYRCSFPRHATNLTAALTKASLTDEKVACYLKWCCVRFPQAVDSNGRTLVHVAASKGRLKLLTFLLGQQDVNINARDRESLYTALHRSLFYGQLHCAVRLIQLGANLQQTDQDDLTPLDHVMKDRPKILVYDLKNPCEVYVWGTNTNYTLGIGHHHSRLNPEPLFLFRKQQISIRQVVTSKFHSLFIGSNGQVWSCGHGFGGRLGLDDENTTLVPKPVKVSGLSKWEACVAASIGTDHSVLLMEHGSVWTFGLNTYHQLGHSPPPEKILSPKQIKTLKNVRAIGVSASKFHTVIWSKNQLFTCGLNGGQLGHLKGDATIPTPKIVSQILLKDETTIEHAIASEGATVIVTNRGDVFLLNDYQCRKLTLRNKQLPAKKICVVGGRLDHKVSPNNLKEKGGDELKILLLTKTNKLFLWQESKPQFVRCIFSLKRNLELTDVFLNKFFLLITTSDGEAFQGEIRIKKKKSTAVEISKVISPKSSSFHEFLDKDECEHVKLKRISHIHRAVSVTSDLKGRNFAVIQVHPKSGLLQIPFVESTEMKQNMKSLLDTADECDSIHDVVFQVAGARYPVHRYVIASSSEILEASINKAAAVDGVRTVKIDNIQPQIFQRILDFAYTKDCDLLHPGKCPISVDQTDLACKEEINLSDERLTDFGDNETMSAFELNKINSNNKKNSARKKKPEKTPYKPNLNDPVRLLRDAAKKFGLTLLHKLLEGVRFENGCIINTLQRRLPSENVKFDRKSFPGLWDIVLKSGDNSEIKAHKCILTARSEYFNCMINQGWLESYQKSGLKIPIPGRILDILIRHLYTDEAPELVNCEDPDLASLTLVVADQYLCTRLKEYAETCLGSSLTLRNAVEMLQIAVTYNAPQLKQCTMEFICLNLPALLESRSLEALNDSILSELRDFYRSWLPCMSRRHIATHSLAPDDDLVDTIYSTEPLNLDSVQNDAQPLHTPKTVPKSVKKKPKDKKSNESERIRNLSTGSLTSDEDPISFSESTDLQKRKIEEAWVKVVNHSSKPQKAVQSKAKITIETESPSTMPVQTTKSTHTDPPVRKPFSIVAKFEKEIINLSTSSEKDFPSLNSSPSERALPSTPSFRPSIAEYSKKFTKLSQKQRKRMASLSVSEDEESMKTPEIVVKSAWAIPKIDSKPLTVKGDSETSGTNFGSACDASSPPWSNSMSPDSSLTAIMAAEKLQRNLETKMKFKPLKFTQMEDKAMEDLLLLYDVKNVTDERITVRRADTVFISPPIWVSAHR